MFNYNSICLTLKLTDNSVYEFSPDELNKIDLSILNSIYAISCSIISELVRKDSDDLHKKFIFCLISQFDTLCHIYDILFSSSRGEDYSKIVFDKVSETKVLIKDFLKKNKGEEKK